MVEDLVLQQLHAHFMFVYPKIHNKKTREQFSKQMHSILYCITYCDKVIFQIDNKGARMALDIYGEIVSNLNKRFITGHYGDYYLERL